jgi:hypothetical protein
MKKKLTASKKMIWCKRNPETFLSYGEQMTDISTLQNSAIQLMQQAMPIEPVQLKHPFPVRPKRMLGLIRFDGQVYRSEKITRAVFMQIKMPVFMKVYSTFVFPKIEYDLPVFTCETVIMGKKRIFIVDAHPSGAGSEKKYDVFFDRLMKIRKHYPELLLCHKDSKDGISSLQSIAAMRLKIPRELDEQAVSLFSEYFQMYLDLINAAEPADGLVRVKLQTAFGKYLESVIDHDPGVKANCMFFGKKEGLERALDIYYGV